MVAFCFLDMGPQHAYHSHAFLIIGLLLFLLLPWAMIAAPPRCLLAFALHSHPLGSMRFTSIWGVWEEGFATTRQTTRFLVKPFLHVMIVGVLFKLQAIAQILFLKLRLYAPGVFVNTNENPQQYPCIEPTRALRALQRIET